MASASFSMDVLKELRVLSGAPVVECKKALQHAGNDVSAAMDWLREHGAAKASSKLQGRETTEGLVGLQVSPDHKSASIVKVASETDFASRSSKFVEFILDVAKASLESSQTGLLSEDQVLAATVDGKTIKSQLDEAIVAIRENLNITHAIRLQTEDGVLVGYVHNRMDRSDAGTSAAIVEVAPVSGASVSDDVLLDAGKKLAMHIVAAKPLFLLPEDVPSEEVEKEKAILTKLNEGTGKPADIVDKIVQGRLRKFYEGICLTEQAHMIEEGNPTVHKHLTSIGVQIKHFERMSIN